MTTPSAATTRPPARLDVTAAPRVVITLASGLVTRMFGDLMPSARDNAWEAMQEDRARAAHRAELADVARTAIPSGARNNRSEA